MSQEEEKIIRDLVKRISVLETKVRYLEIKLPKKDIDIFDLGTIKKDGNGKR